jgi:spore coat protein U domain-containing protein, fimbrial subunit CupE1/2/3/6
MTLTRSAMIAVAAAMLLIGARPMAGPVEQYPGGLMAAAPTASDSRICRIETRPLSFGVYNALATADTDAVGQVIYTCGNLSSSSLAQGSKAIRIELETGLSNQYVVRVMSAGHPEHLEYNIYLDATHRIVWGNGTNGTDAYIDSSPPNRTPVIVPVFGRIFGMQDVPAGEYLDSLIARVVF